MKYIFLNILFLLNLNVQSQTYIVNTEHSKVSFAVNYMQTFNVEGLFKEYKIFFEKDKNLITSLRGQIQVDSIDTLDKKRDSHLKKNDFFHIDEHPLITFNLKDSFQVREGKFIQSHINLTIKGITKVVPIRVKFLGKRTDPWTKKSGDYYEVHAKVNRRDFNITWNKKLDSGGFLLDDEVEINIKLEVYQANEKPAFSRFYKPQEVKKKHSLLPTETSKTYDPPKQRDLSTKSNTENYNFKNIITTLITGFVIFILIIVIGIFGQKKLTDYFERIGLSDYQAIMLASVFIMVFAIIVSYYAAPYMGWGPNKLLE